jgi:small conductance mechanosensitive channel
LASVNAPVLVTHFKHFLPVLIPGALHLVRAIIILGLGFWLSGKAEYFTGRMLARTHRFDEMLQGFFASIARYFVLTITGLTVLSQFGVQTTSLVAVIGAASLAIGLALQGTLSNLAAGVMLLICRPFRLGNHIQVGGNDGAVKNLTLFWTEILTDANVQIIIPNSSVWGQALKNLSTYPQPAATTELRIPVTDANQLALTKDKVQSIVNAIPDVAKIPAPVVLYCRSPLDNSLQFLVKFCAATPDPDIAASKIIEGVQGALQVPVAA